MHKTIFELVLMLPAEIIRCNESLAQEQHRFGGYLCVCGSTQSADLPPIMIVEVGHPTKHERRFNLCQEKAKRLLAHPEHLSSWQSRCTEQSQYGGAIRTPDYVLALAGLIEEADEAILVNAACALGLLNRSTAGAIASYSNNELITA